jgi:hypothetical protein
MNFATRPGQFLVDLLGPDYERWAVAQYVWVIQEEKEFDESEHSNQWKSSITGYFLKKDVVKEVVKEKDLATQSK